MTELKRKECKKCMGRGYLGTMLKAVITRVGVNCKNVRDKRYDNLRVICTSCNGRGYHDRTKKAT